LGILNPREFNFHYNISLLDNNLWIPIDFVTVSTRMAGRLVQRPDYMHNVLMKGTLDYVKGYTHNTWEVVFTAHSLEIGKTRICDCTIVQLNLHDFTAWMRDTSHSNDSAKYCVDGIW
jgi:hypothetical protein